MVLTLVVALIGLGCAWLRRSSGQAEPIRLLWWPLLIVALFARLIAAVTDGNLAVFAEVSMLTALLWFCLRNVTIKGLSIVALGITANLVVVALNEGTPVRPAAAVSAGLIDESQLTTSDFGGPRHLETAEDRLSFLGDNIAVGLTNQVLSFGDLILLAGLGNVVYTASRAMFAGRRTEDSEASRPLVLDPDAAPATVDSRWARIGETTPDIAVSTNPDEEIDPDQTVVGPGRSAETEEDDVIDLDELERTSRTAPNAAATAADGTETESTTDAATADEIDLRTSTRNDGKLVDRQRRTINLDDPAPEVDPDVAAAFGYGETTPSTPAPVAATTTPEPEASGAEPARPYQVRVVESATIAAAFKWDEPATDLELINANDIDGADTARRDGGLGWPAQPALRSEPDPAKPNSPGDLPRADAAEEARLDAAFGPLMGDTDANVVPLMANENRPPLIVRAPKASGLAPTPPPARTEAFDGVDVVVVRSRFARQTPQSVQPGTSSPVTPVTPVADRNASAVPSTPAAASQEQRQTTTGGWVVAETPDAGDIETPDGPEAPEAPPASEPAPLPAAASDRDALAAARPSHAEPTRTGTVVEADTEVSNVVEFDRARRANQLSEHRVSGPVIAPAETSDGVLNTSGRTSVASDQVLDLTADEAADSIGSAASPALAIDAIETIDADAEPAPQVISIKDGSATTEALSADRTLVNSLAQRRDLNLARRRIDDSDQG